MNCEYCFYCDEAKKRERASYGFMSEQTLKNVIRRTLAYADGMVSYAYQGGEPLLRGLDFYEKAVEYQKQYNRRGMRIQNALQTNGILIDEEWCKFFKRNHFLIGISVDGTKRIHDAYRHLNTGGSAYDRVMKSVELIEQYGVPYNILTVVTQKAATSAKEIYTEYKRCGFGYQQYIACLDPLDEEHAANAYAVTPKQYGAFLIDLFEQWYADWKKGREPYIRQFENYADILMGYIPESCEQRGCCGIHNVVEADGSVYPCDFYMLDAYRLGNLNDCRMPEIFEKRVQIGFVERSQKLDEACKSCAYYKLCRGGCQRNRDYDPQTGLYHNYFCEGYKMFFEACLQRLETVAESRRAHR